MELGRSWESTIFKLSFLVLRVWEINFKVHVQSLKDIQSQGSQWPGLKRHSVLYLLPLFPALANNLCVLPMVAAHLLTL